MIHCMQHLFSFSHNFWANTVTGQNQYIMCHVIISVVLSLFCFMGYLNPWVRVKQTTKVPAVDAFVRSA